MVSRRRPFLAASSCSGPRGVVGSCEKHRRGLSPSSWSLSTWFPILRVEVQARQLGAPDGLSSITADTPVSLSCKMTSPRQVKARLRSFKGVGPKTISCVLMWVAREPCCLGGWCAEEKLVTETRRCPRSRHATSAPVFSQPPCAVEQHELRT